MTFITNHFFISLLLFAFLSALLVLFVGGILRAASDAMPQQSDIEPGDLQDKPCAWCQKEQAILAQPHESHGICERHYKQMLEDAKRFPKAA